METIGPSKRCSHPREHRQRDKSEHRNNLTKQGGTYILESTDGQTSQNTETIQLTNRHLLPRSTDRWTSQNTETIRPTKGHSQTGEHRQMDKSEHGKNLIEQGALSHSLSGEHRWMDKSGHEKNPVTKQVTEA
jgi:hypothetical protein